MTVIIHMLCKIADAHIYATPPASDLVKEVLIIE